MSKTLQENVLCYLLSGLKPLDIALPIEFSPLVSDARIILDGFTDFVRSILKTTCTRIALEKKKTQKWSEPRMQLGVGLCFLRVNSAGKRSRESNLFLSPVLYAYGDVNLRAEDVRFSKTQ